jgi:hypothetical protein
MREEDILVYWDMEGDDLQTGLEDHSHYEDDEVFLETSYEF